MLHVRGRVALGEVAAVWTCTCRNRLLKHGAASVSIVPARPCSNMDLGIYVPFRLSLEETLIRRD